MSTEYTTLKVSKETAKLFRDYCNENNKVQIQELDQLIRDHIGEAKENDE